MKLSNIKILILLIVLIFTSCKAYDLNSNDNTWQPYQKGDVLIFENSPGLKETINVDDSYISKKKTVQPYQMGKSTDIVNISIGKHNDKEVGLVRISKDKKGTYLGLSEHTLFTRFGIDIPIAEMSKYIHSDNNLGQYYLINNLEKYRYGDEYKCKSILFSKKYGYIRFDLKEGGSIELKEFIRDGVNILPALEE